MNRRTVLAWAGHCAVSLPILLTPRGQLIAAEELKPLNRNHPVARALKYVDDAANADQLVYESGSNQRCENCTHYTPIGEGRGKCALFQGHSVSGAGWCSGWAPQTTG